MTLKVSKIHLPENLRTLLIFSQGTKKSKTAPKKHWDSKIYFSTAF